MALCLSHRTALEFWRAYRRSSPSDAAPRPAFFADCPSWQKGDHLVASRSIQRWRLPAPLHCTDSARHRSDGLFRWHRPDRRLETASVCAIDETLFVFAPEATLLQMSGELSSFDLVVALSELSARFIVDETALTGFRDARPLVTERSITRFADLSRSAMNSKRFRAALPYMFENAASPQEIYLALFLGLPASQGGCGLPKPQLNRRIPLSRTAQGIARRRFCVADLYWEGKLDLEYDSDSFHTGSARIAHDARRRNALLHDGVEVMTVTREQFKSLTEMDALAKSVAKALGIRWRPRAKGFAERHSMLHRELVRGLPQFSSGSLPICEIY